MKITIAEDVELGSPEEALFWGLCHFHNVPVETVSPQEAIQAAEVRYRPGFRVAVPRHLDTYVEIADGRREDFLRLCRFAWRDTGRPLVVLYREELESLVAADRPSQFVARLKLLDGQSRKAHW